MSKKKPDYSLWPPEFNDVIFALENGAEKYGRDNWRESLMYPENYASMRRHLEANWVGDIKDKESGLHPLLHLACRALMEYAIQKDIDRRHPPDEKKPQMNEAGEWIETTKEDIEKDIEEKRKKRMLKDFYTSDH